jgi:hypothetical protein
LQGILDALDQVILLDDRGHGLALYRQCQAMA